ncbi:MAG: hypothetical protein ABI555_00775 [Chloroflexota bacterium]
MRRLQPLTTLVAVGFLVACAPSASVAVGFLVACAPSASVATVAPTSPASAEPAATASPTDPPLAPSTDSDAPIRIGLPGAGPLGLDIVDGTAFVAMHDSGELAIVDLATGTAQVVALGDGLTHVLTLSAERSCARSRRGRRATPAPDALAGLGPVASR